ncbi:Eaa1 [Klebsiella oxytoca]|nr:Eaa1 [Klebsiella oxytoca]SAP45072.1 Eaa1 [Klebsiella oxytoca]SAP61831.1 Eaa1 [Klebsiella oxytoca]
MTNNQLTDEQIAQLLGDACMVIGDRFATVDELTAAKAIRALAVELQERRKAEKNSEPVVLTDERNLHHIAMGRETSLIWGKQNSEAGDIPLYRHAQTAPERDQVRNEHAKWSQATFGKVGPIGPLKHLSKEALEAAAETGDLSEWADMQFLMWDAQRRAGITDEQITQAMIEKLAVNKQREWPAPKDGEPRQHIKERPRKKVDRCDVCTEGARGGCGTCIFNGKFE